jgi:hypothetical protein
MKMRRKKNTIKRHQPKWFSLWLDGVYVTGSEDFFQKLLDSTVQRDLEKGRFKNAGFTGGQFTCAS